MNQAFLKKTSKGYYVYFPRGFGLGSATKNLEEIERAYSRRKLSSLIVFPLFFILFMISAFGSLNILQLFSFCVFIVVVFAIEHTLWVTSFRKHERYREEFHGNFI